MDISIMGGTNYGSRRMENYSLSWSGGEFKVTSPGLGSSFSDLARVEWYSTRNPVVSPIVFWDEHTVSLISIS
jgi:hypothetical protein